MPRSRRRLARRIRPRKKALKVRSRSPPLGIRAPLLGNRIFASPAALTVRITGNKLFRENQKRKAYELTLEIAGTIFRKSLRGDLRQPRLPVRILGLRRRSAGRFLVPDASKDDRPPMVVGMYWVQQITSIAVEMALPAAVGHYLDLRWGTGPWLLAVGAVFGFLAALWHLWALAKRGGPGSSGPTQGTASK